MPAVALLVPCAIPQHALCLHSLNRVCNKYMNSIRSLHALIHGCRMPVSLGTLSLPSMTPSKPCSMPKTPQALRLPAWTPWGVFCSKHASVSLPQRLSRSSLIPFSLCSKIVGLAKKPFLWIQWGTCWKTFASLGNRQWTLSTTFSRRCSMLKAQAQRPRRWIPWGTCCRACGRPSYVLQTPTSTMLSKICSGLRAQPQKPPR